MADRWGNSGSSVRLYFLGSKITADGDSSHEIKRCLLLGRKVMTNLDSIFKSRDITLSTKVHLVKAMVFPMSQLFAWGGQSTGVSALASCLPKNTQGWSPLEWTGWISLQSKGLTRVFSNTTVQKHQFFRAQLSSQSNSHIHTWPLEKPQPWSDGPLLAK